MNEFEKSLFRLDEFCKENEINYAVIGGIAVITYGYPRSTNDIDITVLCDLEELEEVFQLFTKEYIPILTEPLNFFKRNFILPLKDKITGIKIDIAAGLTVFDDTIIKRRKRTKLGEAEFYICTLEDLIIYKLFAERSQDMADVEKLFQENNDNIDSNYLIKTAEKFKRDRKRRYN